MPKEIPIHKDRLGRVLNIGDVVAMPRSPSSIDIGQIIKLNPKMVGARTFSGSKYNKYPAEIIKLEDKYVTQWLLTKGST